MDIYNILEKKITKKILFDTFKLQNGNTINIYNEKTTCNNNKQIITIHGIQEEICKGKVKSKTKYIHKTRWSSIFEIEYLLKKISRRWKLRK